MSLRSRRTRELEEDEIHQILVAQVLGGSGGEDPGRSGSRRLWHRYWAAEELALGGASDELVNDGLGPMHGS